MFDELYVRGLRISGAIPPQEYVAHLPVVRYVMEKGSFKLTKPVTILVGENGVGKSTLLEALAVALGFNPEGGTVNYSFATADSHSPLHRYLTVSRGVKRNRDGYFLRAESFYNAASYLDELEHTPGCGGVLSSYGGKSLHHQSHGESFMSLVANRFGGHGLYLLDEPEAALSPMRQMELLCHMNELVKQNSQFIISTHSPILMTYPDADLWELSRDGMRQVSYRETEHYQLTRNFLENPERMLGYLFGED